MWEIPPNGQGLTALLALNLLASPSMRGELEGKAHNSADYLHVLLEAMRCVVRCVNLCASLWKARGFEGRAFPTLGFGFPPSNTRTHTPTHTYQHPPTRLAFADTRHYVADPTLNPAPLDALLSPEYAAERAKARERDINKHMYM